MQAMTNQHSTSTALGLDLSKISAALSIMKGLIEDLPDGQNKKALLRMCMEGLNAYERAFEDLQELRQYASRI
jgi:hypothetical protein